VLRRVEVRLARAEVGQVDPAAFIFSASAVIAMVAETSIRLIRSVNTLSWLCSYFQSRRFTRRDKAFRWPMVGQSEVRGEPSHHNPVFVQIS